jgi:zinc protease
MDLLPRVRRLARPARLAALLALLALAFAPAGCSSAPAANGAVRSGPEKQPARVQVPESLDAGLPVDPRVTVGRLDNGLTYYLRRNTSPEDRAELWLVVNAGSILEDEDQRGLAHFVEHMAFNGTRHFARQELVSYLESIGMRFGPDVNAYTSFDETMYLLQVPTDHDGYLERGIEILEDWAHGITFDPEEVDQERGVLVEEWRLGRGAARRLIDAQTPVLFAGSRYAERLPIGSREVLETAPVSAVTRFYHDWYRPDLMAVIAVGDFEPSRVEDLIRERFGAIEGLEEPRERLVPELPRHDETLFATFTDPELTGTSVSVYTKLPRRPQDTVGDYRRSLVELLYHRMLNDRLYELGHRPSPPYLYAFSDSDSLVRTGEVDQQEAGVEPGRVLDGLRALLTEIERVRRFGFTESELERNRKALLRAYERTWVEREARASGSFAAEYSRAFLEGEPIPGIAVELELARRYVPAVTLDEVNALADRRTGDANRVILVSGPESAAGALPSEADLLAAFEQVRGLTLEPYEDQAPGEGLMAELPEPGEIVSRREIPEIGVNDWRLSNGVRVVLKPTEFRRDEVFLTGFSPGGHSLVPDEVHLTASHAAEIVSLGGLGDLDEIALAKVMAGRVAEVGPYIDELEEGVSAGGSAADLEEVFQLVHLALTRPRLDLDAVRSFKERLAPSLENRLADPQQVFLERMFAALTQDHPRRQPLTAERLAEIDPELALVIYEQRFADAGDFTFVLVGSFEPAAVEDLVRTYLASLPATGRTESWRDIGLERPDRPVELTVERGIEPKASVWLVLHGEAAWSRESEHLLASLGNALEIRLREVLREDLGAVYGVSVAPSFSWRPRERYSLSITFGCAPDQARELIERVHEVIDDFRRDGPPDELAARVREIQTRAHETDVRENAYWLHALGDVYRRGADPTEILDYAGLVSTVTPEALRNAAGTYLDWGRRVLGIHLPETGAAPPPASGEEP